jgi:hypothetical protein
MKNQSTPQLELYKNLNRDWIDAARRAAIRIAKEQGQVSSDEVRRECPITGSVHRKAMGSLFKTKDFIWSGVKKSTTKTRKGGMIGVYTLSDQAHN